MACHRGGEFRGQGEGGTGSTFTLYLPASYVAPRERKDSMETRAPLPARTIEAPVAQHEESVVVEEQLPDDRDKIAEGDRVVLIVEDDVDFARILVDMARGK